VWRTTPSVLLGLALAGAAMVMGRARGMAEDLRRPLSLLLLFAALFTIFMSLGAKKFDRYLLPIYPPLALTAGVGWVAGAGWLRRLHPAVAPASLLLVVGAQAGLALSAYPYYLSYYNPLLGGTRAAPAVMMVGWGEGLDQAAEFLNSRPGLAAPRVMVGVWGGTFSYYFRGELHDSKFAPGAGAADEWAAADFCVIYINQWQRHELPAELLSYLAALQPAMTVRLQGLDYAYVYDIRDVPPPDYLRASPAEAQAVTGEE
jgi:4-amino-4-deoxy-L-arabinose transferase-like glycosyltransferase